MRLTYNYTQKRYQAASLFIYTDYYLQTAQPQEPHLLLRQKMTAQRAETLTQQPLKTAQ